MQMQVLTADYGMNGNKPIIRLFGKTDTNNTICLVVDNFFPYFYIKAGENIGRLLEAPTKIMSIKSIEETEKRVPLSYEKPIKLFKITTSNPQDIPKLKEKFLEEKIASEVYEADVMFKYRFMVDHNIHGMQWIEFDGERTQTKTTKVLTYRVKDLEPIQKQKNSEMRHLAIDIECVAESGIAPDAKKDPIVMISLAFSSPYKGKKDLVLVAKHTSGNSVQGFTNEADMLKGFLDVIDQYDPDVITGYNINAFDFPYILTRLEKNKLSPFFGRSNDKPCFVENTGLYHTVRIPGRIVADPYIILKKDPWLKFQRYDLGTVAKALLGQEKYGVEYGEMHKLWRGNSADLKRFVEYARRDAVLSLKLVLEKELLAKFVEIAKISGLLLQDCFGGQTMRIDCMVLHEFRRYGFVMPLKPSNKESENRSKERDKHGLKGAVVLEPKKGLHKNCVIVLDFKSLYPNIIKKYNISPDTLLKSDMDDIKYTTSPNGVKFVDKTIQEGVVPKILRQLVQTRADVKKLMKTAKADERKILNAKQLAIKDLSNSFYGYTGYIKARLYVIDVAASITAYGRQNIENAKAQAENNFDVDVIYGDTDSLFLETKTTDLDVTRELAENISKTVTENVGLELAFEKIYKTLIILTKKRYAGWKFEWYDGKWSDELEMKGIETVRRDWCPLVGEVMLNVLNIILKEGNTEKAMTTIREVLQNIKAGEIPIEKFVVVKGITKSIDSYAGVQPHIELAKKVRKRDIQKAPSVGDRIGFVIIKGNEMLSKRAEDPTYAIENKMQLDFDYYIQSQLFPPLERIMDALGADRSEVLGNGKQLSLRNLVTTSAKKKLDAGQILNDYDHFECNLCGKNYTQLLLAGYCTCGGSLIPIFGDKQGSGIAVV